MSSLDGVFDRIFALSGAIRYAAIYRNGELASAQRAGVEDPSSAESDRYEELFINPALLTLVRQRGRLDCGGSQFVLIRYGHFYQLVLDLREEHASICFALGSDPLTFVDSLLAVVQ